MSNTVIEFNFTVKGGTGMDFHASFQDDGNFLITFENGKCYYKFEEVVDFLLDGQWILEDIDALGTED